MPPSFLSCAISSSARLCLLFFELLSLPQLGVCTFSTEVKITSSLDKLLSLESLFTMNPLKLLSLKSLLVMDSLESPHESDSATSCMNRHFGDFLGFLRLFGLAERGSFSCSTLVH